MEFRNSGLHRTSRRCPHLEGVSAGFRYYLDRICAVNPANPKRNPRALVVRLGAMGDVLHALPAVAMLRRALPEARIGWVDRAALARAVVRARRSMLAGPRGAGRPLVDEVHLVDTRGWRKHILERSEPGASFWRPSAACGRSNYDAALDLQGAIKSAVMAKLSGATTDPWLSPAARSRRPLAVQLARRWPRGPRDRAKRGNGAELAGEDRPFARNRDLAARYGPAAARQGKRSPRMDETLQSWDSRNRRIAILNPGAGWGAKQWAPSALRRAGQRSRRARFALGRSTMAPAKKSLAREAVAASAGKCGGALQLSQRTDGPGPPRPSCSSAETLAPCIWQPCWE